MPAGFVIGAVGAIAGGVIAAQGAQSAAQTQANAAQNATNAQEGMFNQVMANEQPFINEGKGALAPLNYGLGIGPKTGGTPGMTYGGLTAPFTTSTFKQMSPAYQFALQQGGQGVLNQDATGGSALAGPALKDLISFNSQFANQSFNNAFNQYQQQQQNTYARLAGVAGMGMQAGSGGTTGAPQFAGAIGSSMTNVGTAQAAGQIGVANALSGAAQSAAPWLAAANMGGGGGGATPFMGGGTGYAPGYGSMNGPLLSYMNPDTSGGGGGGFGEVPY